MDYNGLVGSLGTPMDICPHCGSNRIRRSRSKGIFERLRRGFSRKRIFRCQECGWRGWGAHSMPAQDAPPTEVPPPPDVDAIDRALGESAGKRHTAASS